MGESVMSLCLVNNLSLDSQISVIQRLIDFTHLSISAINARNVQRNISLTSNLDTAQPPKYKHHEKL